MRWPFAVDASAPNGGGSGVSCARRILHEGCGDGLFVDALAVPIHGAGSERTTGRMHFLRGRSAESGCGDADCPSRQEGVRDSQPLSVHVRARDDRPLLARRGIELVRCGGAGRDDAAGPTSGVCLPEGLQARRDESGNEPWTRSGRRSGAGRDHLADLGDPFFAAQRKCLAANHLHAVVLLGIV